MAKSNLPKRISLGDVSTQSERVMPGVYHARVANMELKENKAKDGHYFNADLVITSENEAKGRHIWEILPLKEKALFKLKGFLVACGVDGDADVELEEIPELTIGSDVDVVVGEEEYESEMKAKVKRIKPSTAPGIGDEVEDEEDDDAEDGDDEPWTAEDLKELDPDELAEVAEEFEVKIKKGMKKSAIIKAILEAQDEAEEEDDEDDDAEDGDEYDEMSKAELKAACKEAGLKGYKAMDEDELREFLRENSSDDEDEDGEGDDDDDDLLDDLDEEEEEDEPAPKKGKKRVRR